MSPSPSPFLSGFTIARNVLKYEYPFPEVLSTLLELCDEVVVALSPSEDGTEDLVEAFRSRTPELKVIWFYWDDSLREGGRVLAEATRCALAFCTGRWCLYLQADELLHEEDFDRIHKTLFAIDPDPSVEALVLPYYHFYGSYDYIGVGRQWYRYEVRIFRNTGRVEPYRDAQGFRVREGKKLRKIRGVKTEIPVYHYGWVRPPRVQMEKLRAFYRLYHSDEEIARMLCNGEEFLYTSAYEVQPFTGTHPRKMQARIASSQEWTRRFDPLKLPRKPLWMKVSDWLERRVGIRIGEFRNYTLVQPSCL